MTTGAVIVSILSGLFAGGVVNNMVAPLQGVDGILTPDKLISAGAAGLVMVTMWMWMKRDEKQQALHAEAVKLEREQHAKVVVAHVEAGQKVAADFSQTATNITRTFAESTKEMDLRAQQREAKLADLFQNLTRDRA